MTNQCKYERYKRAIKVDGARNIEESPERMSEKFWNLLPGFHPGVQCYEKRIVVDIVEEHATEIDQRGEIQHHTDKDF